MLLAAPAMLTADNARHAATRPGSTDDSDAEGGLGVGAEKHGMAKRAGVNLRIFTEKTTQRRPRDLYDRHRDR